MWIRAGFLFSFVMQGRVFYRVRRLVCGPVLRYLVRSTADRDAESTEYTNYICPGVGYLWPILWMDLVRQTGKHNVQSDPNIGRADRRFEHAVARVLMMIRISRL